MCVPKGEQCAPVPFVPFRAQSRERCDFFAPQSRRAAPPPDRQPDIARLKTFAPTLQKSGKLHTAVLTQHDVLRDQYGSICRGKCGYQDKWFLIPGFSLRYRCRCQQVNPWDRRGRHARSRPNERMVGRELRDRRDRAVIATRFGNVQAANGTFLGVNGRPEYVRSACEASLSRQL